LPNLLRRVVVLTATSAVGIALLAPLAVQSARQPGETTPISLLDATPATSTLDRGSPGRERLALYTLLDLRERVAPETLSAPRALPTPAAAEMEATIVVRHVAAARAPTPVPTPPPTGDSVTGLATWYCCSEGWRGEAVVALPGAVGGHYDAPPTARSVTVCAEECASLPVVDYCDCFWGTPDQKVADLSPEAWELISDAGLGAGVIRVTIHLD
jgi:hypothetical protein